MLLPLRLYAEPVVRKFFKTSCFVLPTQSEDTVCLVVGDAGLVALAISDVLPEEEVAQIIGCTMACLPRIRLVCNRSTDGVQRHDWYDVGVRVTEDSLRDMRLWAAEDQQCACSEAHTCEVPRCLTEAINRYYARQVLEPSIRGFLGILEKQFPRNDLYLFELLQNAVDDGASHVCFKAGPGGAGLEFFHNGRGFTALDVLGLASVGLSTKGIADGPKRTIGFMGVGFKAVYKRYAAVQISDDRYRFCFTEPNVPRPNEPSHGWVLQPSWMVGSTGSFSTWLSAPANLPAETDTSRWCRFQLMRPRGGAASVMSDLSNLPRTVPPLLGRKSLENGAIEALRKGHIPPAKWTLEWHGTAQVVSRASSHRVCYGPADWDRIKKNRVQTFRQHQIQHSQNRNNNRHQNIQKTHAAVPPENLQAWRGEMELSPVSIFSQGGQKERQEYWRFLTVRFIPDADARKAYEVHTKRPWAGVPWLGAECPSDLRKQQWEECTIFYEELENATPVDTRPRGCVHAVLPTKLTLPCGLQWQGPWLLSVDRQEVQNVGDNAWNAGLLRQAPQLLQCLMLCAAEAHDVTSTDIIAARRLRGMYALLPPLEVLPVPNAPLTCFLLGDKLDMSELSEFTRCSPVVPCLADTSIQFASGHEVLWLPHSLVRALPLELLQQWAGPLRVFAASYLFNFTGWLELWRTCLVLPTQKLLQRHRSRFKMKMDNGTTPAAPEEEEEEGQEPSGRANTATGAETAVKVLAALQAAMEVDMTVAMSRTGGGIARGEAAAKASEENDALRSLWMAPLTDWPVFVAEDGQEALSSELVWLSEGFIGLPSALRVLLRQGAKLEISSRKKKLCLMHPAVEGLLLVEPTGPENTDISRAQRCASAARELHPSNVIHPVQACRALLRHWSRAAVVSQTIIDDYLVLARWAKSSSQSAAISHVLAHKSGSGGRLFILPSTAVALGSSFTGTTANPLQSFIDAAGFKASHMAFADDKHLLTQTPTEATQWGRFLVSCGVRTGPSISVSSRVLTTTDIRSNVTLAKLSLRKNQPTANLTLPYGLCPINRKNIYELDAHFDSNWTTLLSSCLDVQAATFAATLIGTLLSRCDCIDPISAKDVPAAALLLSGKAEPELGEKGSCVYPEALERGGIPLMVDVAAPAMRRHYYLPSGSAGAAAVSCGPAEWVRKIAMIAWVPAGVPGESTVTVVRPCECVLDKTSTGPMPVAHLSPEVIRALQNAPTIIQTTLAWGTVKPRPPIDRMETLVRTISEAFTKAVAVVPTTEQPPARCRPFSVSYEDYTELVNLWRAICLALREGRLSVPDQARLSKVCGLQRTGTSEATYISTDNVLKMAQPVLPGPDGRLYSHVMCVDILWDSALKQGVNSIPPDNECAAAALVRAGHLLSLGDPGGPLAEVVAELRVLLKPRRAASRLHCIDFLRRYCSPGDEQYKFDPSRDLQSQSDRKFSCAYSWALYVALHGPEPVLQNLRRDAPSLQVFCRRGPSARPDAHPACWLSAYACFDGRGTNLLTLLPILVNDTHITAPGCGIAKSTMLRPSHCVQPLALLDHTSSDSSNTAGNSVSFEAASRRLTDIDIKSLRLLGIPRLTDPQFTLRVGARGRGHFLKDSSLRLKVVLLLLTHLRSQRNPHSEPVALPRAPQLLLFDDLHLYFSSPHIIASKSAGCVASVNKSGEAVEKTTICAVWGAPSQRHADEEGEITGAITLDHPKPLLLAGESESYVAELEELVLAMIFGPLNTSIHGFQAGQLSVTKILRLLLFLQHPDKFNRYLLSDFGAFCPLDVGGSAADVKKGTAENDRNTEDGTKFEMVMLDNENEDKSVADETVEMPEVTIQRALEETVRLVVEVPVSEDAAVALADSFLSRLDSRCNIDLNANNSVAASVENTDTRQFFNGQGIDADSLTKVDNHAKSEVVLKPDLVPGIEAPLKAVPGRSGRGVSMLPAWMTAPGLGDTVTAEIEAQIKSDKGKDLSTEDVSAEPLASEVTEDVLKVVSGRSGRGMSMLPAWMTAPGLGAEVVQDSSAVQTSADIQDNVAYVPPDKDTGKAKRSREELGCDVSKKQKTESAYGPGNDITTAHDQNEKVYGPTIDKLLGKTLKSIQENLVTEEELELVTTRKLIFGALTRAVERFA